MDFKDNRTGQSRQRCFTTDRTDVELIEPPFFLRGNICMTTNEVIEILKESQPWPLVKEEKQEVIIHILRSGQPSTEIDIEDIVGEVYLGS